MKKLAVLTILTCLAWPTTILAAGPELIENGSFEIPNIPNNSWSVWSSVTGWTIDVTFPEGNEHDPELEVWDPTVVPDVEAYEGDQCVELDGYDPTKISQTVATVAGWPYELKYAWRPRPGKNCDMKVWIDGDEVGHHSGDSGGWSVETHAFQATTDLTVVAFAEVGPDDQLGMLLDAVSLKLVTEEVDLCAGQSDPIGTVHVWNDCGSIYVEFVTDETLLETHVHVGENESDFPLTKKGNPIPGQFASAISHPGPHIHQIAIESAWGGQAVKIGAHAAMGEEECITIVSGDGETMVTQRRSGNEGSFTTLSQIAVEAWEPGPSYPNDGADDSSWETNSLWDQRLFTDLRPTGADWIWESYRVQDPIAGTVLTFERQFNIGWPISGSLLLTCDNGYEAFLNGTSLGSANVYDTWRTSALMQPNVDVSGWDTVGSFDLITTLEEGANTLTIDAANEYFDSDDESNGAPGTESSNPGGLIFALDLCYYANGETAWGDGCEGISFPGKNWATYFEYTVDVSGCP